MTVAEKSVIRRLLDNLAWHWATKRTRLVYGWRLAGLGHGAVIEPGVRIDRPRMLSIGAGARIRSGVRIGITGKDGEHITIGDNANIDSFAWLDGAGGHVEIGKYAYVGPYTYIGGHGGCKIGDDCQIAGFCYIIAANHEFNDRDLPIRLQGYVLQGITIGPDCWFGNGVTILDGITIGKGCVVAARSVVTRCLPEYAVAVGSPARVVKYRGEDSPATSEE